MKPPEIIAELSGNHLGQYGRAIDLITAAKLAGADAVKVQCWTPHHMVVDYNWKIPEGPWAGRNLAELYAEAYTPTHWLSAIFHHAQAIGIKAFASVFDHLALRTLERIDCPRYKIASCELIDTPLIAAVARTGKPIILSTGMATEREIRAALATFAANGTAGQPITLLKCTAAYPAPNEDCNLTTIRDMQNRFSECEIGLSDHTLGSTAAVVATGLGATMIEKHLTLQRTDGGPDAGFSSEPEEFAQMVKAVHQAAETTGKVTYGPSPSEAPTLALRRSLWWTLDVHPGQIPPPGSWISARPALGVAPDFPMHFKLQRFVKARTPVQAEDFK